jgi:hypothetical protein
MRNLIDIMESAIITTPQRRYWFRGLDTVSNSKLGRRVAFSDLPPEVSREAAEFGHTEACTVHNYEFRISRTYSGMSNWGFGVYLATDIPWARRYGNTIMIAEIDPALVLAIDHRDFVNETPGTAGGRLYTFLHEETYDWSEQAAIMFKMVKRIKPNAKALFVQTDPDGSGQICVFNKNYLTAKWVFECREGE